LLRSGVDAAHIPAFFFGDERRRCALAHQLVKPGEVLSCGVAVMEEGVSGPIRRRSCTSIRPGSNKSDSLDGRIPGKRRVFKIEDHLAIPIFLMAIKRSSQKRGALPSPAWINAGDLPKKLAT
jgi:hypothetical protein